jgi:hypothetical protein
VKNYSNLRKERVSEEVTLDLWRKLKFYGTFIGIISRYLEFLLLFS